MSKMFDLFGFRDWLLERQKYYERAAEKTTNQVLSMAYKTRSEVFHQVRVETERFTTEANSQ